MHNNKIVISYFLQQIESSRRHNVGKMKCKVKIFGSVPFTGLQLEGLAYRNTETKYFACDVCKNKLVEGIAFVDLGKRMCCECVPETMIEAATNIIRTAVPLTRKYDQKTAAKMMRAAQREFVDIDQHHSKLKNELHRLRTAIEENKEQAGKIPSIRNRSLLLRAMFGADTCFLSIVSDGELSHFEKSALICVKCGGCHKYMVKREYIKCITCDEAIDTRQSDIDSLVNQAIADYDSKSAHDLMCCERELALVESNLRTTYQRIGYLRLAGDL